MIFSVVSKNSDQWKLPPHKNVQFQYFIKTTFILMSASPKYVIKSSRFYNSEETIMDLDSLSRPKQVGLSRLKCKLIAVKFNGHKMLMKIFAFCTVQDLAMWSSLCPAFSAFYTYSLTKDVHSGFSIRNYGQPDATNHMKNKQQTTRLIFTTASIPASDNSQGFCHIQFYSTAGGRFLSGLFAITLK